MKAAVQSEYGLPAVLRVQDIERPTPKDDEVLVKVRCAAVHIGDLMLMRGEPYIMRLGAGLRRPKKSVPGFDFSGVVEEVGKDVTAIEPGDEAFGEAKSGSCAEFVVAAAEGIAPKPASLTFEEAAAVPVSGVTALRGIRDAGKAKPGDKVLINGATGGVGMYAVQIAKALGAEVTGVCGPTNVDLCRELGVDHVIDYTTEDYADGGARYDLILDNVANHSLADARKALTPDGSLIPNSARSDGRWFGAVGRMAQAGFQSLFIRQQGRPFYSPVKHADLLDLTRLIDDGKVRPIIDRTYPLAETADAMEYIAGGHASGKTVITVAS